MDIEGLIFSLRATDRYVETIFSEGGCYKFHLFLAALFPGAKALINKDRDHVVTLLNDSCYDITGKVERVGYHELSADDLSLVERWSFSRTRLLSLGECPNCEEPLIV
jgi:hypothetical protein